MKNLPFLLIAFAIANLHLPSPTQGRAVSQMTWESLTSQSDLVAIVEAVENLPAKDEFLNGQRSPADFEGINTRFRIRALLKGEPTAAMALTVLHFRYSQRVTVVVNGPSLIEFPVRSTKPRREEGPLEEEHEPSVWIAFLQKLPDGRFIPVTGNYDALQSFFILHSPAIAMLPSKGP